jgi:hypothetical protein
MAANARWAYEITFSKDASLRAWIHHLTALAPAGAHVTKAVAAG